MLDADDVSQIEDLMFDAWSGRGRRYRGVDLEELRERRTVDHPRLVPGVKSLLHPHIDHVSLSERLWTLKQDLIRSARA